jgi:hypothetical protein
LTLSDVEVETLMVFDWDDTLFPTSWLQRHCLLEDTAEVSTDQVLQLRVLAENVKATLQMAMQLGKVVIVTNAEQGWIEASCTRFMPSLIDMLKTVDIVSARTTYGRSVKDPALWKRLAFSHEVELFYGATRAHQQRNIISLGDSLHELNALKAVTTGVPNCCGKSIKLLDTPSIEQLIEQHELLVTSLLDVLEHNGDIDVEIGAEGLE